MYTCILTEIQDSASIVQIVAIPHLFKTHLTCSMCQLSRPQWKSHIMASEKIQCRTAYLVCNAI